MVSNRVFVALIVFAIFVGTILFFSKYAKSAEVSPFGIVVETFPSDHSGDQPFLPYESRTSIKGFFEDVEIEEKEGYFLEGINRWFQFSGTEISFESYLDFKRFFFTSEDFTIRRCGDVFGEKEFYTGRYFSDGRYNDSRKRGCYEEEYILLYKNHPILSLYCGNIIWWWWNPERAIVQHKVSQDKKEELVAREIFPPHCNCVSIAVLEDGRVSSLLETQTYCQEKPRDFSFDL